MCLSNLLCDIMAPSEKYTKLSKHLSYILRHDPDGAGLELDEEGFAPLYHGTSPEVLSSILDNGLKPMGRRYVHLSRSV